MAGRRRRNKGKRSRKLPPTPAAGNGSVVEVIDITSLPADDLVSTDRTAVAKPAGDEDTAQPVALTGRAARRAAARELAAERIEAARASRLAVVTDSIVPAVLAPPSELALRTLRGGRAGSGRGAPQQEGKDDLPDM